MKFDGEPSDPYETVALMWYSRLLVTFTLRLIPYTKRQLHIVLLFLLRPLYYNSSHIRTLYSNLNLRTLTLPPGVVYYLYKQIWCLLIFLCVDHRWGELVQVVKTISVWNWIGYRQSFIPTSFLYCLIIRNKNNRNVCSSVVNCNPSSMTKTFSENANCAQEVGRKNLAGLTPFLTSGSRFQVPKKYPFMLPTRCVLFKQLFPSPKPISCRNRLERTNKYKALSNWWPQQYLTHWVKHPPKMVFQLLCYYAFSTTSIPTFPTNLLFTFLKDFSV